MSDFAFVYRGRERFDSPEKAQRQFEKWVAWFKGLHEQGHVKDIGHPLEDAGGVVRGAARAITDGPFAEAKDVIGGFTLVEAADLAQALELAKGCPILESGGSVEVRPIQPMTTPVL